MMPKQLLLAFHMIQNLLNENLASHLVFAMKYLSIFWIIEVILTELQTKGSESYIFLRLKQDFAVSCLFCFFFASSSMTDGWCCSLVMLISRIV